ncbi:hypothetical protein NTGBS_240006 [Candidatus Nitrotoga sp. BS]|nr:hypothetical protein NTGBS_240006 [Candidatus Nitrotoga sp. BS]
MCFLSGEMDKKMAGLPLPFRSGHKINELLELLRQLYVHQLSRPYEPSYGSSYELYYKPFDLFWQELQQSPTLLQEQEQEHQKRQRRKKQQQIQQRSVWTTVSCELQY